MNINVFVEEKYVALLLSIAKCYSSSGKVLGDPEFLISQFIQNEIKEICKANQTLYGIEIDDT